MNIAYDKPDVLRLLNVLNLYENRAQDPYFNRNVLNDFYCGKKHFTSVNIGNLDVKFGDVIRLIGENYASKALRSGHTTDWYDIDRNNTGLLDYNNTVTANGRYGVLMLHDQTETENTELSSGDTIYLPGSKVVNGERVARELYVFKNGKMEPCDRTQSYFMPACYTREDGQYVHLIKYLKEKNESLPNLQFNYESDAIVSRAEEFEKFLAFFLDIIKSGEDDFLPDNFFRKTVRDGIAGDVVFEYKEGQFLIDGKGYTQEELISLILLPFRFASIDDSAEPAYSAHSVYPLLHNSLLILFIALAYNYPMFHENKREVFRVHFHWGAIGMAGYPPAKKGYFRTASKTVKKFHSYLQQKKEAPNLFFILIPVFPFLFYSDRREGKDLDLLTELFRQLKEVPAGVQPEVVQEIEAITTAWIKENRKELSPYFLSKFKKKRSILFDGGRGDRELESPGYLQELEYRTISIVVGALFAYFEELMLNNQQ